jgi:hypothetical protein
MYMRSLFILSLAVVAFCGCKVSRNKNLAEYTFTISVREKYCYAARLDETLMRESEKEKPFASSRIFFVKKGTTDTLNLATTLAGQVTQKLETGVYQVFFPEKFAYGPQGHTQRCKDWRLQPDTTMVLDPSMTQVPMKLYRPCSPCNPLRP